MYRLNAEAYLAAFVRHGKRRGDRNARRFKTEVYRLIILQPYQSQVNFYIDEAHASGMRHLVVVYENGEPDFLAGIPDDWADENVQDFIFWPMKNPNSPFPLGRCRRAPMAVRCSMLGGRAVPRFSEQLRNSLWMSWCSFGGSGPGAAADSPAAFPESGWGTQSPALRAARDKRRLHELQRWRRKPRPGLSQPLQSF